MAERPPPEPTGRQRFREPTGEDTANILFARPAAFLDTLFSLGILPSQLLQAPGLAPADPLSSQRKQEQRCPMWATKPAIPGHGDSVPPGMDSVGRPGGGIERVPYFFYSNQNSLALA